jgi:uncharacterized protein
MRRFLSKLFLLAILVAPFVLHAFEVPARPTGFVQDYASLLTPEQVKELEAKIQSFEKNTTNEIAVVTIPSLDGDVVENVAQEIFTKWGIGKAEKNNGVLFLVSLEDRKTRIHTGYGLEGDLTDLGTSYIQSEVVTPAFKNGDYYGGINGAVDKMIEALGGNNIVPENYSTKSFLSGLPWDFIFFLVIVVFQILAAILGKSKSWWHGGVLGGGVGLVIWHFFVASIFLAVPMVVLLVVLGLLFDYLVSKAHTQKESTGMYPWWFGGGHGGGGGGGFGGFGGGGSGGGGSSGSW